MNALIVIIFIIAMVTAPSEDNVRGDISLDDRGNIICESGVSDGRKTLHDSTYTADADREYKTDEAIVSCHAKILSETHRSISDELLLNRLEPLADHIASEVQRRPNLAAGVWTLSVFYGDSALQAKILSILKARLTENHISLRQQMPLAQFIDGPLADLPELCHMQVFSDPTRAHMYVIQIQPNASALRAAICTRDGWSWL